MDEYKGIFGGGKVIIIDGDNICIKNAFLKETCNASDILGFRIKNQNPSRYAVEIITQKTIKNAELTKMRLTPYMIVFNKEDSTYALIDHLTKIAPTAKDYDWSSIDVSTSVSSNISPDEQQINNQLEILNTGKLPDMSLPNVILAAEEVGHFQMIAQLVEFSKKFTGMKGSSTGLSFRVTKGVSIRTGGVRGNAVYEDVQSRFTGTINITNQRFIFLNKDRTVEFDLKKITAVTEESGGVYIHIKGKQKPQIFVLPGNGTELLIKALKTLAENR